MIRNFVFVAFGFNIVIAGAIIVFSVLRYRKTEGFSQSLLWGVGIALISNVFFNLVGGSIFPTGFGDMNLVLAIAIRASLMTVGICGAYIVASSFQFKKGIKPKSAVINAIGFSIIPLMNTVMQAVNFIAYSSAINAGTADKFLTETFKAENLAELTKVLTTTSPLLFLDYGITRLLELAVIIVIFTLLLKSINKDARVDFKKALPVVVLLFGYYFIATLTEVFASNYLILAYGIRIVIAAEIFRFFYKSLDI